MEDLSDAVVRDLLAFIDASPTPYHAVRETARRLDAAGFSRLDEAAPWRLAPGGSHYVVRGGGSLVAFLVGEFPPAESGFIVLGAHTDSPGFRVKPTPEHLESGHLQLGVEVYGGPIYASWLDRDLSLAGRVCLADGRAPLVDLSRAVARIPSLAIHLDRSVNTEGLRLNPQRHLLPSLALALDRRPLRFRRLLAESLAAAGVPADEDQLLGFELMPYDVQRASLGGLDGEFLFGSRLDNLVSCHAALEALLASGAAGKATRVIALYDHEEIGSQTQSGARSRYLLGLLDRLGAAYPTATPQGLDRAVARSLLVSVDMAHAVHPSYPERHDPDHKPQLGQGPVLKLNACRSYGTDGPAQAVFESLCREAGVAPQYFVSRNDQPCGSTIGPATAAQTGLRTVDVGSPMLSMHSCREMAGTRDVAPMLAVLTRLLRDPPLPPSEV